MIEPLDVDEAQGFKGSIEGSQVKSKGNTDATSLNFDGNIYYNSGKSIVSAYVSRTYAKDNGEVSGDSGAVQLRTLYRINDTTNTRIELFGQYAYDYPSWVDYD